MLLRTINSKSAAASDASDLRALDLSHSTPTDRRLPVLIVLHQEMSTPGRVGNALRALGYALDIAVPGSAMLCRERLPNMPVR